MGEFEDKVKALEAGNLSAAANSRATRIQEAEAKRLARETRISEGDIQHEKLRAIYRRISPAMETMNTSGHSFGGFFTFAKADILRKKKEDTPALILPYERDKKGRTNKIWRTAITTTPDDSDKYFLYSEIYSSGGGGHITDIPQGWHARGKAETMTANQLVSHIHDRFAREYVHQKSRTPWRVIGALAIVFGLAKCASDAQSAEITNPEPDQEYSITVDPDQGQNKLEQ